MDRLAEIPVARWLANRNGDLAAEVDDAVTRAGSHLQVFVAYDIPHRDCGNWSAGGASGPDEYSLFLDEIAAGLGGRTAIVVLEPDATSLVTCLDPAGQAERHTMLADAVDTLGAAGAKVYIDAGDSNWIPAADMAERLRAAGVDRAAGFALNVSHTEFTTEEIGYAEELRSLLGDHVHYVIDTSRNGLGPNAGNEWCNPLGRANGQEPTLEVGDGALDALLWIKPPGESDGWCNGGPAAGAWWPEYARELAELTN